MIGFRFLATRVLGVPIPFHRDFDEVNLRFYVRRKVGRDWRRGVVFVKELVPRRAIAWVARWAYGENYAALPMRHSESVDCGARRLAYQWRRGGGWEGLLLSFSGPAAFPSADAEEAFITEHYWGYSRLRAVSTVEYQVEHPRWRVWRATAASLDCDVASLYGPEFSPLPRAPPLLPKAPQWWCAWVAG